MKIAVTFNNGEVFEHFGHAEKFKVYEVEDGKVVSSEVIGTVGAGHGAMAGLLSDNSIDALICGGIGEAASEILNEKGIEVYSGISGNADEAVEKFLKGELESGGANCDHHHEDEECEGHSCSDGCGSCCSGCHHEPLFEGKNVGKKVKVHYKGTLNDGTQFDSSYDRGEPLEFECGMGMMILGFDKAVAEMEVGEIKDIHLMPEEAYGEVDPNAFFIVDIENLPGSENLNKGEQVYLRNAYGQAFPVTVVEKDDKKIKFDANHEMAGKELNFKIELLEVE